MQTHLKYTFTFIALFFTFLSPSQESRRHARTPEELAYGAQQMAILREGGAILSRARGYLYARHLAKAEVEAVRALDRLDQAVPPGGELAHELLAEIYVVEGRYDVALSEAKRGQGVGKVRSGTTMALALIGLGRLDEARPLVARAMTGNGMVVYLLGSREDLPMAHDPSASALAATAYLLRAADQSADMQRDFETAFKLAPGNPMVALNLGRYYRATLKRPDLARTALISAKGGSEATRRLLAQDLAKTEEALAAKKTGPG